MYELFFCNNCKLCFFKSKCQKCNSVSLNRIVDQPIAILPAPNKYESKENLIVRMQDL